MRDSANSRHAQIRADMERQVDEFFARGGVITQVEQGGTSSKKRNPRNFTINAEKKLELMEKGNG